MKRLIFVLLFLPLFTKAQFISTIAGTGTIGYTGDGGVATAAQLYYPAGIVIDDSGSIYFTDHNNSCIRKISPSGIISTVAGNGTAGYSGDGGIATDAQLCSNLWGIAVDHAGNIYIADENNQRIRKVNTSGIISTFAGNGTFGFSGDGGPAVAAQLCGPSSVAVDNAGNVYICDQQNHRIRKVDPSGIITTIAGSGTAGFSGDGGSATSAKLNYPSNVFVDNSGNVFISDQSNYRIRIVNTSGIINTFAGSGVHGFSGDGSAAADAALNYPGSVAADTAGNVYIADSWNHRVRKVNTSGIITTVVGDGIAGYTGDGGLATEAEISAPWDLAIDNTGNIFIGDYLNSRIRKINAKSAGLTNTLLTPFTINVYPNPAENALIIAASVSIVTVAISNISGQVVFENSYNEQQVQVDVSNLLPGIYFIKINSSEVRKFLKE